MIPSFHLRSVVSAALAAATAFAAPAALAAPTYHLVDLGANTTAYAINKHGHVAGTVEGARRDGAAVYRDGAWHGKSAGSLLVAIDDDNDIGGAGSAGLLYWPAGGAAITIPMPFDTDDENLGGISSGKAVGNAYVAADDNFHCFYWTQASGSIDFTGGTHNCAANGVNAAGQVTGSGYLNGSPNVSAFRWENGVFTDLGALGGIESEGVAINSRGHVAMTAYTAYSDGATVSHLALYNGHKVVNLGSLDKSGAEAFGLNDRDDVIGVSWDKKYKYQRHAVVSSGGVLTKLDEVTDNIGDWDLGTPRGIDNAGVIVGDGYLAGVPHAYMLVLNPQ